MQYTNYSLSKNTYIKARIGWQGLTTAEYLETGDYYLVTGTDIKNGYINFNDCVFVSEDRYSQDSHIQLKLDDVLISNDGTIGKVAYINKLPLPATLNSGVFLVRCDNRALTQKYFYYLLQSTLFKNFISQTSAGSTITHLYQKDIVKFSFDIPEMINIQHHIVNIMESVDFKIDELKKNIKKVNGIFETLLRKTMNNTSWSITKLGNISKIYQPQTIASAQLTEFGYDVYGANGIIGKYSEYNHEKWQNLITCRGSTCGTINKTTDKVWINGNAMVVNVDENKKINKKFLYYLLKSCDFTKCISGSGQPQIVRGPLINYEIRVPNDKNEQDEIVTIFDSFENYLNSLNKKLKKYENIREGLLNGLFTGKIDVPENYEEV